MIEPCWFWLKVVTSKYGAPTTKEDAAKRWIEAWQQLSIQRIRVWIRRIMHHIQEVIRLEGNNNYIESTRKYYKSKGISPPWETSDVWEDLD